MAGAGTGTIYLALLHFLPDDKVREVLAFGAPSFGIVVSVLIHMLNAEIHRRKCNAAVVLLRSQRDRIVADPRAGKTLKLKADRAVDQMEKMLLDAICESVDLSIYVGDIPEPEDDAGAPEAA